MAENRAVVGVCNSHPPARQVRSMPVIVPRATQRELYLLDEQPGEEAPYERLLCDAMAGGCALFAREDAVEAAWAVVDPVLKKHRRTTPYKRGSWGPKEANALIAADGCWYNPGVADATSD